MSLSKIYKTYGIVSVGSTTIKLVRNENTNKMYVPITSICAAVNEVLNQFYVIYDKTKNKFYDTDEFTYVINEFYNLYEKAKRATDNLNTLNSNKNSKGLLALSYGVNSRACCIVLPACYNFAKEMVECPMPSTINELAYSLKWASKELSIFIALIENVCKLVSKNKVSETK